MINRRTSSIVLTCLLVTSSAVYLQNLGTPYITLWDEAVHVNVVKNLAEHCCLPELHRFPGIARAFPAVVDVESFPGSQTPHIGTDYRDWTNNTLWLHKPLLPFYVTAAIYKLLGGSLWALRLPGAIFAILTALVVYLIGDKFLDTLVGLFGAAIFSLNPYTNELVHGREFSGFPDLAFAFFMSLALYLILDWTQKMSAATLRWLGLVLGLGYMCKGGLALAPFAVVVAVIILSGRARDLISVLQSALVFGITALPERLYWLAHHSVEFRYEEHVQVLHLFRVIEAHGGSWRSYVADYLPSMLAWPLVPFAYFSIGWGLVRCRPPKPGFILSIWTLIYLVPLSFGVSKIENFIFAVIPAIALLVPYAIRSLMYTRRFAWVVSLCISSAAMWISSRATSGYEHWNRLTLLAGSTIFLAVLAVLFLMQFRSRMVTTSVLVLTVIGMVLLYLVSDIFANDFEAWDSSAQAVIRQTGLDLRASVDKDGLILSHNSLVDHSYLYLMYWSGVDVLDICRDPQPSNVIAGLRERRNIYLISDRSLPAVPLRKLPIGNLYALKEITFGAWSPVALEACHSQ